MADDFLGSDEHIALSLATLRTDLNMHVCLEAARMNFVKKCEGEDAPGPCCSTNYAECNAIALRQCSNVGIFFKQPIYA